MEGRLRVNTLTVYVTPGDGKSLKLSPNKAWVPSTTNDKLEIVLNSFMGVIPLWRRVVVGGCPYKAEKPMSTNASTQPLHLKEADISGGSVIAWA